MRLLRLQAGRSWLNTLHQSQSYLVQKRLFKTFRKHRLLCGLQQSYTGLRDGYEGPEQRLSPRVLRLPAMQPQVLCRRSLLPLRKQNPLRIRLRRTVGFRKHGVQPAATVPSQAPDVHSTAQHSQPPFDKRPPGAAPTHQRGPEQQYVRLRGAAAPELHGQPAVPSGTSEKQSHVVGGDQLKTIPVVVNTVILCFSCVYSLYKCSITAYTFGYSINVQYFITQILMYDKDNPLNMWCRFFGGFCKEMRVAVRTRS